MMFSIEAKNLSHRFSNRQLVLDKINLHVPIGSIYGFIGPNGAGKTTTLRLILGLLQKQEGEISIFDQNFERNKINILGKTGSLIEVPSVYGHLTAHENLRIWQLIYQCPKERIEEVLRLTGLADTGNKKARNFSLGMKQRLGLAITLLNEPTLLILDEPTNGLDPNGIFEMRELLQSLNREKGITILISSHLLSEIEKFVTNVGIIDKGKILFEGSLGELAKKQTTIERVIIKTADNDKAINLVQAGVDCIKQNDALDLGISSKEEIAAFVRLLVDNNIDIYEIRPTHADLETTFMNLTGMGR